jgi:hypothetical protein
LVVAIKPEHWTFIWVAIRQSIGGAGVHLKQSPFLQIFAQLKHRKNCLHAGLIEVFYFFVPALGAQVKFYL